MLFLVNQKLTSFQGNHHEKMKLLFSKIYIQMCFFPVKTKFQLKYVFIYFAWQNIEHYYSSRNSLAFGRKPNSADNNAERQLRLNIMILRKKKKFTSGNPEAHHPTESSVCGKIISSLVFFSYLLLGVCFIWKRFNCRRVFFRISYNRQKNFIPNNYRNVNWL